MKKTREQLSWKEIQNLHQQQQVLKLREHTLPLAPENKRGIVDAEALSDLKTVSPEKLSPVVFYSVEHGWKAGFLIQKVGRGGARILVKQHKWCILRVRNSAIIHDIKPKQKEIFDFIVELQENLQKQFAVLLNDFGVSLDRDDAPVKKKIRKSA